MDFIGVGLLLVASLSVAADRRYPRAAFAVSLALIAAYQGVGYSVQSPFFLPLVFTAYSAGLGAGRGLAAAYALISFAVFGATGFLSGGLRNAVFVPVITTVALAVGEVVGEFRAADERRQQVERRRQEELLLTEERLRIARELHDVVSHSIAMIGVQAGVAAHVLDRDPQQARSALVAIKSASREALQDLHGILGLLRQSEDGDPRSPAAGLARLSELVESVGRTGIAVSVTTSGKPEPLSPANDLAAYRIIQEALTNVVRHAPGARTEVKLNYDDGGLEIEVVNDEVAAHGERVRGAGQGLAGMRERAAAAGGSVSAGPRPDGGFVVRARLAAGDSR
jgi:signal transduction histidine kinase